MEPARMSLIVCLSSILASSACFGAERAVVPFGCPLDSTDCLGPSCPEGCTKHPLSDWPEVSDPDRVAVPLREDSPYAGGLGVAWARRINAAYKEGRAAGLAQDTFRSYDRDHSSLPMYFYPQMNVADPLPSYLSVCKGILTDRVTMGVQSLGVSGYGALGMQGRSIIEFNMRSAILAVYNSETVTRRPTESFYKTFYENNFFFVAPAVDTFTPERDSFTFLSPLYLNSIGASGTDSILLQPLVFVSAALPPELKTRIMRKGLFVPTMMGLFKSHIAGDITDAAAHVPAYNLPEKATAGYKGETSFLDGILTAAQGLTHIPPVARLKVVEATMKHEARPLPTFFADNLYSVVGTLQKGQTLAITIDLSYGWIDDGQSIERYTAKKLRGSGEIERLNDEGSLVKLTIPWALTPLTHDMRSDFLFLVNDGAYNSAPAYVSIRHIHQLDPLVTSIRVKK